MLRWYREQLLKPQELVSVRETSSDVLAASPRVVADYVPFNPTFRQ